MKSERQSMALVRGSDRDPGAVEAALGNVTRAGLEGQIEIVEAPMGRAPFIVEPLGPRGTWVSNPPHGGRVGQAKKLKNLYQSLGTRAGRLGSDWRVALVVSDKRQAYATGLSLESRLMTDHGGRKVWIMTGRCA